MVGLDAGDNGSWGWLPVIYLAGNDGDAPYRDLVTCASSGSSCDAG